MKIPSFDGKNEPDAFIEWERKIELKLNWFLIAKIIQILKRLSLLLLNFWAMLLTGMIEL